MSIKKIVYVLSTNYAGSHFTVLQLASHSKCISAGELHRFDPDRRHFRQACHICDNDEQCPVFNGLRGLPRDRLHAALSHNIATAFPDVDTLVDNSKKTAWAGKFLDLPNVTQKYIHVVRDPRALVRRWMMNYDNKPEKNKVRRLVARRDWRHAWDILVGSEANVYLRKWVYQNRLITDFMERHRLDHKIFLYDELVFDTDRVLRETMEWIGHDYEPAQKAYWSFVHHGTQKAEYMRPPADDKPRFDTRWRDFLPAPVQKEITAHRGVEAYLGELGLAFTGTGLARRP